MEMNSVRVRQETENDALRTKLAQGELVERIRRLLPVDGTIEPLTGLQITRHSQRSDHILGVYEPSICVIAQGRKEVLLGNERYPYDSSHYLVNTVDLPVVGQIVEASRDRPYLSLRVVLDPTLVSSILVEANLPAPRNPSDVRGIDAAASTSSYSTPFYALSGYSAPPPRSTRECSRQR